MHYVADVDAAFKSADVVVKKRIVNQRLVARLLEKQGHTVVVVGDVNSTLAWRGTHYSRSLLVTDPSTGATAREPRSRMRRAGALAPPRGVIAPGLPGSNPLRWNGGGVGGREWPQPARVVPGFDNVWAVGDGIVPGSALS